jgi:hypothetical protein
LIPVGVQRKWLRSHKSIADPAGLIRKRYGSGIEKDEILLQDLHMKKNAIQESEIHVRISIASTNHIRAFDHLFVHEEMTSRCGNHRSCSSLSLDGKNDALYEDLLADGKFLG